MGGCNMCVVVWGGGGCSMHVWVGRCMCVGCVHVCVCVCMHPCVCCHQDGGLEVMW